MVERRTETPEVVGSIPTCGTTFMATKYTDQYNWIMAETEQALKVFKKAKGKKYAAARKNVEHLVQRAKQLLRDLEREDKQVTDDFHREIGEDWKDGG